MRLARLPRVRLVSDQLAVDGGPIFLEPLVGISHR